MFVTHCVSSQVSDSFNDGDFTQNPKWLGEVIDFKVDNNNRLQLFAPAATSDKVLYTNSAVIDSAFWKMDVFLGFNPSSANYLECYLAAENENFTSCNALFFKIGGSKDNIELYSRQNGTETLITKSGDGLFTTDSLALRIQITKTGGIYTIDTSSIGSNNFVTLATSQPILYSLNPRFFGYRCVFTSTRSKKFYFDNIDVDGLVKKVVPKIDSIECINDNTLSLVFNKILDQTSVSKNDFVLNDLFTPSIVNSDSSNVVVKFDQAFSKISYDKLRVSNLIDLSGNTLVDTIISFFCGTIENPQVGDVVINEIMADPTPAHELPPVEFIELYNASTKTLQLSDVRLFNENTEYILSIDTLLFPNTYYTIARESDIESLRTYGVKNLIPASIFPALTNDGDSLSLVSNTGEIIDIVSYTTDAFTDPKKSGGYSLERVNFKEHCNNIYNFRYATNAPQATPSAQNSVLDTTKIKFELENASWINTKELSLQFSHSLDVSSLVSNAIQAEGVAASSILHLNKRYTYSAMFQLPFNENQNTAVELNAISNCLADVLDTSFTLTTPLPSNGQELHITELMIDPTPSVGLPEAEYIELYNASNYDVQLSDYALVYNSDTLQLPTIKMNANEYLILINGSDTAEFIGSNYVVMPKFPNLLNSSGSIALHHLVSNHSVPLAYNTHYYQDVEKQNGGYSIESIRIDENCLGKLNFKASTSLLGGTPAQQNSVFENTTTTSLPSIESFSLFGTSLVIVWDRNIQYSSQFSANSLQISPVVPMFLSGVKQDSLFIDLPNLELGTRYVLSIADFTDCIGNTIDTLNLTLTPSREPRLGELVITEIMADPSPSFGLPEVEYFELYNPTSENISLNNLNLNGVDLDLDYSLESQRYIAISRTKIPSTNNLVSQNISTSFFTNSGKKLELYSGNELITELDYTIDWHDNPLAKDGGISLELLNTNLTCTNNRLFWGSSTSSWGGTPGASNSISQTVFPSAEQTLLYYKNQTLSFAFNAPILTTEFNTNLLNQIDSAYLSLGNSQINFVLKIPLETTSKIFVFQVTDCNTEEVILVNETIELPQQAITNDVVINEIMFEPKPNQTEYIELRNTTTHPIMLSGLFLNTDNPDFEGNIIDTLGLIIRPNAYLFLSKDTLNNHANYDQINPLKWYPYFAPTSLNNSESFIGLHTVNGHYIDSIYYTNSMHYPLIKNTQGIALERISSSKITNLSDAFASAAQNSGYATPGLKNSTEFDANATSETLSLSDDYLSVNGDGYQDVIEIRYTIQEQQAISLIIYDRAGFVAKTLAKHHFHSGESTFVWKGNTDNNTLAESGVYILVLSVDSNGSSKGVSKRVITVSR